MSSAQNSGSKNRFLDVDQEPKNLLPPIRGYEKQPLLSLEEAVQPLYETLNDVDIMVRIAKQNSQIPPNGLTSDESAAIYLYTMEWQESYLNLYTALNHVLRSSQRISLEPWFCYLKLILTGLYKLPSVQSTVWRGFRGDLTDLYHDTVTWWGFTSCTTTIADLEKFIGTSGVRTVFTIECRNGKDIGAHSFNQEESEILLMPCTHFQVVGKLKAGKGINIIHLKEIDPPYPLLQSPVTSSTSLASARTPTYMSTKPTTQNIKISKEKNPLSVTPVTARPKASVKQSSIHSSHCNDAAIIYVIDLELPMIEWDPEIVRVEVHEADDQLRDAIAHLNSAVPFCILAFNHPSDEIISHGNLLHYYYLQMQPKKHVQAHAKIHDRVTSIHSIEYFASELYGDLGRYYRDKAEEALFHHQDRMEAQRLLSKSKKCFEILEHAIEKNLKRHPY